MFKYIIQLKNRDEQNIPIQKIIICFCRCRIMRLDAYVEFVIDRSRIV
ncbi:hypothetical protein [Ehrlichia muris]|nr:hypothetical protein [Ehrlichia muris]